MIWDHDMVEWNHDIVVTVWGCGADTCVLLPLLISVKVLEQVEQAKWTPRSTPGCSGGLLTIVVPLPVADNGIV